VENIIFYGMVFLLYQFEWRKPDGDEGTSISWNDEIRESEKNGKNF